MQAQPIQQLSPEDKAILSDLAIVGATTPIQFEIKTHRIGADVRSKLTKLATLGYVQRLPYKGGIENEVFALSPQGYKLSRSLYSLNGHKK